MRERKRGMGSLVGETEREGTERMGVRVRRRERKKKRREKTKGRREERRQGVAGYVSGDGKRERGRKE